MKMRDDGSNRLDEERDLARLLKVVGPNAAPPQAAYDEVRAAVEAEWRAVVSEKRRKQSRRVWPIAAGIAAAGMVGALLLGRPGAPAEVIAMTDRVSGTAEHRDSNTEQWQPLTAGNELRDGDQVRTGPDGRIAVTLASGLKVRIDNDTQLALNDREHATLAAGAVYVDSGVRQSSVSMPLEIATPLGNVTHLGTQYEARLLPGDLTVSVREGRVGITRGSDRISASAGERVVLSTGGVARTTMPAHSSAWAWAGEIAPLYAIDGQSLGDFLDWAGRETGRDVVYASNDVATAAGGLVLHGSVEGLTPDQALAAVLATTTMSATFDSATIRIDVADR